MSERFLDKVYDARTADQTRALYDAWSGSYESEVAAHGYATPGRSARALAAHIADKSSPVLDFGCGTGLSGEALSSAGITLIDGVDLSADMLALAAAKGIYRTLKQISADASPLAGGDRYGAIAAIGVIGAGAAPISVFDMLMDALQPEGRLVLSFNDHALEDPANESAIRAWCDRDAARLLFEEYGPHLPGIGLRSKVYVIEKM